MFWLIGRLPALSVFFSSICLGFCYLIKSGEKVALKFGLKILFQVVQICFLVGESLALKYVDSLLGKKG